MTSKRYCFMCGATEGTPHHDDAPRHRVTTIHRTKQSLDRPNKPLKSARDICMRCRDGVYALLKERRGK